MSSVNAVYKCNVCLNMVEVLLYGGGKLICCDQPMELLPEKTGDQGTEKHTPVIEKSGSGVLVKVGSVPHPMEDKHWINWIEILTQDGVYRKTLNPGMKPEAEFNADASKIVKAREFCNVHGLWKSV